MDSEEIGRTILDLIELLKRIFSHQQGIGSGPTHEQLAHLGKIQERVQKSTEEATPDFEA